MRGLGNQVVSALIGGGGAVPSAASLDPSVLAGVADASSGTTAAVAGVSSIAGLVAPFAASMFAIADNIVSVTSSNKKAAAEFALSVASWQDSFDKLAKIGPQNPLDSQFQPLMDSAIAAAAKAIQNSPAASFGASSGLGPLGSFGYGAFGSKIGPVPQPGTIDNLDAYIANLTTLQGKGKNVAQDRDLATLLSQLQQLDAEYKKQTAAAQLDEQQSLQVRLLRAQGNTQAADALALQIQQQKEYTAAVQAGYDASTLALLKQVQAQEALTAATNGANAAALNMVNGYKLQATIFSAIAAQSGAGSIYGGSVSSAGVAAPPSGDLTVPVSIDGKVVATAVLKNFRSASSRQTGDSTKWSTIQAVS